MHPEHWALLSRLTEAARPTPDGRFDPVRYLGTDHAFLNVSVPDRRRIARGWMAAHKDLPISELLAVLDSLFAGASTEEKTLGPLLLESSRHARAQIGPAEVDRWLHQLVGWAEIDTLCQNIFTPEQMLADWPAWKALIEQLARDPNINRRRAALVLLTGTCRRSADPRLSDLAFTVIDRLRAERAVIITKAISWLLRGLIEHHRDEVVRYLDANAAALPAIAVRETRKKMSTGRK